MGMRFIAPLSVSLEDFLLALVVQAKVPAGQPA
jgi:hypothetical protein